MIEKDELFNLTPPAAFTLEPAVKKDGDPGRQFSDDRAKWTKDVVTMAEAMREVGGLADVSVELYSKRQFALEQSHYLQSLLMKMTSANRKNTAKRQEVYSKTRASDIPALIAGDLADELERIASVSAQIEFLRETIKTIDNMIYGIKTRLAVEEYRRPV